VSSFAEFGSGRHTRARERPARPARAVVSWLARAHDPKAEIAAAIVLYALYEGGRGIVGHSFGLARRHAEVVIGAEKSVHLFWEQGIQRAVETVPGLMSFLGGAYMSLHLGATVLLLVWLYKRHPDAFPVARTALIAATALALVVHIAFPTAPPRLVGLTSDEVSDAAHINLNSHVLGVFYNPIAAMPSMHFGYALLVGLMVARLAKTVVVRLVGLAYPPLVLFMIVATGNHFILDAAAGAAVMLVGWLAATALVWRDRG
jgi:hypothetical protein